MNRPKIDHIKPELDKKKLTPITNQKELRDFLATLRSKNYSEKENAMMKKLGVELQMWLALQAVIGPALAFFAWYDEPNDQVKKDGWGHQTLYRCMAALTQDGEVHILTEEVAKFDH